MPDSSAQAVLAELSRSLEQDAPADVLQYCADYFHDRLREQRSGNASSASRSTAPSSTSTAAPRKGPGGMSLPFASGANVFSHHVSQPSPFSEHGPADSPFGAGAGGGSSLAQRRATTAYGGAGSGMPPSAGVGPLGGASISGAGATGTGSGPSGGLAQLAEEREDDQSPGGTAVNGMAAGQNNFFGGFSFDGGAQGSGASGAGGAPRFPPQASSSGAAQAGDDLVVPSYALGRRTSVSAESLVPSHAGSYPGGALGDGGEEATPTPGTRGEPKTPAQLARIKASIAQNFLFRNLDDDQERDVLAAMKEVSVRPGEVVIEQGAAGDYFYVVEKGTLDIFVKKPSGVFGLGASEMEQKWGKKVHTCQPGSSFGELALMYNAPRAATVIATEESTLWALDRISFRTILYDHTSRKRRMYESFLATVPILSSLEGYERAKIADALESRTFQPGEVVIQEGEAGDEFYLIESGDAEVSKQGSGVVGRLGKGDYFGELALLNREPRAATVRAAGADGQTLRVGALGEKAFTRLLGPVREIMARTAGERYGLRSTAAFGQ